MLLCRVLQKVCSLDWHSLQPSLLCVGLYDGNVAVLDATAPSKRPWHSSTVKTGKHFDPVWDGQLHEGILCLQAPMQSAY